MSDNTDPQHDDQPEGNDHIAELRAAAERGKAAAGEAAAAKRELAFVKAGIDTDAGVGKLLFESYQGEPTKEAVLAAASAYGIAPGAPAAQDPAPTPAQQPDYTDAERAQSAVRADLATGSEVPAGQPDIDPHVAGLAKFHEARAAGTPRDDAAAAYFGTVLTAAANGDKRAVFDEEAHRREAAAYRGR